jgi:hypothetical protein
VSEEDFFEELFEEPEELPAVSPAPAQPAPALGAGGLEELLEEVERAARYLRGKELLQRLLCPSDAYSDAFVVEGDLVVVRHYAEGYAEGLGGGGLPALARELRALTRRHARLARLVHELRSAGLLPSDVVVVDDPSLPAAHAAVFASSAVALFDLAEPPIIAAYPFGEELVELLLGEEGEVEEIDVAVGRRVGEWIASAVRDILGGARLRHLLRDLLSSENLLSVLERVAAAGGDPQL